MAGGKVLQHVNSHAREDGHEILVEGKHLFHITSTHHQMMYPYTAEDYEIIGVSSPALSDVYFKNDIHIYEMVEEPEIVWYPDIRGLAIQGHPEMMAKEEPVVKYLNELIINKLNNDLPFS